MYKALFHTKLGWIAIMVLMVFSCRNEPRTPNFEKLNGYWEIELAQLPNGDLKEFSVNTTIDFIETSGDSGLRKKVMPQWDGSFITTKISEEFQIKIENDSLNLYYKTPYAQWKETVLKVTDSVLRIQNADGKIFRYKKFNKFESN